MGDQRVTPLVRETRKNWHSVDAPCNRRDTISFSTSEAEFQLQKLVSTCGIKEEWRPGLWRNGWAHFGEAFYLYDIMSLQDLVNMSWR